MAAVEEREDTSLGQEVIDIPVKPRARGLRITIAMSNDVARWGLRAMLDALPAVDTVTDCRDTKRLAECLTANDSDVLVMCADAEHEGFRLDSSLRGQTAAKVLVLLRGSDDADVVQAVSFDADGYLLETDLTPQALEQALTELLRGGMPLPTSLARELLAQLRRRSIAAKGRPFLLTAREQQALQLLADGLSNKQIARQLGISEHGAKRHVANVLAKLNCPNRTLAVALALRDGLLDEGRERV